jgi:hypothetical protein
MQNDRARVDVGLVVQRVDGHVFRAERAKLRARDGVDHRERVACVDRADELEARIGERQDRTQRADDGVRRLLRLLRSTLPFHAGGGA